MKKIYLLPAIPFLFTACYSPTYGDFKAQAKKDGFSDQCINYAISSPDTKPIPTQTIAVGVIVQLENCRTRELIQSLRQLP